MKKLLMSLALLGTFAAMSAKGDSYIFWMADVSDTEKGDNEKIGKFSYANLVARAADGTTFVYDLGYGGDGSAAGVATTGVIPSSSLEAFFAAHGNDYQSLTYAVELYNEDFSWMKGQSATVDWVTLASADAFYQSTLSGGAGKMVFDTFTYNAPEPTSGLLMLIGFCGLALKRKRV